MSSGQCANINWGEFCSGLTKTCVAGSQGQGCESQAGRCGTCYRARARTPFQPILEWACGFLAFVVEDPDILADDGLQAGDMIRQIDGVDVTKALIAAAANPPASIKLRYYRPTTDEEGEVEVPSIGNASGFIGLALSNPGPLASYEVNPYNVVTHINNESVSPQLFIDLADDPEGEVLSLTYRDFTFAVHNLTLA